MQRILDRAFEGFVMLRERPIADRANGNKQTAHSFRVHDERTQMILGMRISFEVWNVVAHPLLSTLVPPDLPSRGIPGLAFEIARSPVVHHAAVGRPRPPPVRVNPQP